MDPVLRKEIYERCPDLPARAGDTRLRPYEWHFLMALDGRKTVEEIVRALRLDDARVPSLIHRLCERKLMEIPELTWEEFTARHPGAAAALHPPAPDAIPPEPSSPQDETGAPPPVAVAFAITRATPPTARPAVPAPAAGTDIAADDTADALSGGDEPPLNLKQLIDYVTQHAGGGLRGKLAVYRLFLRVPNEQIRAAGIDSLNFVDDRFEIGDSAMRNAILEAVLAVTGRPYPLPFAESGR